VDAHQGLSEALQTGKPGAPMQITVHGSKHTAATPLAGNTKTARPFRQSRLPAQWADPGLVF